MAVDALGRPLKLILTPGQRGDAPLAPALLEGLSPRRVLADKAYDSNALRSLIADIGAEVRISEIRDSDFANSRTPVSVIPGQSGQG